MADDEKISGEVTRMQILGVLVLLVAIGVLVVLIILNEITFWIGIGSLIFYVSFGFWGPAMYCRGCLTSSSMKECDELYDNKEKYESIGTINELQGHYSGKIIAFNTIGAIIVNLCLLHEWYGQLFSNETGCGAVLKRWIIIPTFLCWNYPILGYAKLKENMFVKGSNRQSIALVYTCVPIVD